MHGLCNGRIFWRDVGSRHYPLVVRMSRLRPEPVRACAAERCLTLVKPGELMCRAHWLSLPKGLRSSILDAWKHRKMRDYAAHCQAAVDCIAEREETYTSIFEKPTPPGNMVFIPFGGVAI